MQKAADRSAATRELLIVAIVAATALLTAGCGGGGNSTAPVAATPTAAPPAPAAPPPPSLGSGRLEVTVRDAWGAPLAGARVQIYYSPGLQQTAIADANGRAAFEGLSDAGITGSAELDSREYGRLKATFYVPRLSGVTTAETVAIPTGGVAVGLAGVDVSPGGVSSDGRSLQLRVRLVYVKQYADDYYVGRPLPLRVRACAPVAGNDVPAFRADCVSGAPGFDAAYAMPAGIEGFALAASPSVSPQPFAATLLVEQGQSVVVDDPADRRLIALRYFSALKRVDDAGTLAAFADGAVALLPSKPVTTLPEGADPFAWNAAAYTRAVASLGALEGGSSPLLAAIDRAIDLTAANAPAGRRRALIVLATGSDDGCGTADACTRLLESVAARGRAAAVEVHTIALASRDRAATLVELAQRTGGMSVVSGDPADASIAMAAVTELLGGRAATLESTVRVEATAPGAFASGRTVRGRLEVDVCPWDCEQTLVPFSVTLP